MGIPQIGLFLIIMWVWLCVCEVLCVKFDLGVSRIYMGVWLFVYWLMIGYSKIPLALYIAEEFAWEYEDEGREDFLASSLFECDYHWSGKEAPFCVLFLTSLYFFFFG